MSEGIWQSTQAQSSSLPSPVQQRSAVDDLLDLYRHLVVELQQYNNVLKCSSEFLALNLTLMLLVKIIFFI